MNRLLQTAQRDMLDKRTELNKVAFGARGRMARAVAADAAKPIVNAAKVAAPGAGVAGVAKNNPTLMAVDRANRLTRAAKNHARTVNYDVSGNYRRNNVQARLAVTQGTQATRTEGGAKRLSGLQVQRRTGVAPGMQNRLGMGAPATGPSAAAPATQAMGAQQSIAQQQAQAVRAQRQAARQQKIAPVNQLLNSDVEAAQARIEKAQEHAQKVQANAQAGLQAAQTAQGGAPAVAPAVAGAQQAPASSLLGVEMDPVTRKRILMGAAGVGAVGVGALGMRYMNRNDNQNQY